ncbi:hypothetical protein SAMN05428959_104366 [Duganella sp. CF517]|uniref:DUF6630 family protein n=1 Tax=Duganella sp. CF517 TaxID=1881038 RepID=UPI0008ACEFFF|nr:hypothetical protein [Duganella sp. CF517]SEO04660.1 hypothetical protein SAMN05428959_104366 [Duganella sp. CF517]
MLKRLFAFLNRQPEPDYLDAQEYDSAVEARAASDTEAMAGFMRVVTSQLGEQESARLTNAVLKQLDSRPNPISDDDVGELFLEALVEDEGQQSGKWMMMHIDWKASDEIDWQVNDMLATRGIDEQWEWNSDGKTVMQGLKVLAEWLPKHALSLLSIDFGHDAYYMLIVDNAAAAQAIALGRRAGLDVTSFQDFAVSQGEA